MATGAGCGGPAGMRVPGRDGAGTPQGHSPAAPRHARGRPPPALRGGGPSCHPLRRAPAPHRLPQGQDNVSHYDTFLLHEGEEELYVGARDRVLALTVGTPGTIHAKASILWGPTAEKASECAFKKKSQETECFNFIRVLVALNQSHLYTCGTYAFSPACAYIHLENFTLVPSGRGQPFLDGKGQCPFDPQHTHTALLVDGELYAGTMNNFQGNEPIISRSLGNRTLLKTDAFLRWLSADAAFVASFSIPGDDKVYFFFEETAEEFDFFERLLVPRVARVCKSDVGGDKVLQKKWTTFLKAQLVCSQPGRFPFNVIHHAVALPHHTSTHFYAVFTSQWWAGRGGSAAVCAYSQEALEEVFQGKYKELNKESSRWTVYGGPDMSPRPGSCYMGPSSDKALTFMKDHFLMDGKVSPIQGRPLLVTTDVTYTRIAVDETRGVSGDIYRVMFLATAEGFLHKAVELSEGSHIVESIQLFGTPEPVKNLLLSPGKGTLYVGYSGGVLQVPLANCSVHQSCAECILARDPYCAWHSLEGSCQPTPTASTEDTNVWLQDIKTGSPATMCHRGRSVTIARTRGTPEEPPAERLSPLLNAVVRLPCPQPSAMATYSWQTPGDRGARVDTALLPDQTLVVIMQRGTAGTYRCQATENGYTWTVAHYQLQDPGGTPPQDGLAEEGVAWGAAAPGDPRSYWPQFVTVTVLLVVTVAAAACLALLGYREQLRARSKVRGCSPHSPPTQHREKVPLNGGTGEPPVPGVPNEEEEEEEEEEEDEGSRACCLQLDGDVDAEKRLGVGGDTA
ncbi:semaphorin-4A [Aegotheles albertisi]